MSKMSGFASRQRGIGMLAFIVLIGLAAFFITIILKLGPMYMNYLTLRSVMDNVAERPELIEGGSHQIRRALEDLLNVNSVEAVSYRDFDIKKVDAAHYDVKIAYERRTHLFFNVDAVASFSYQVQVETTNK